MKRRNRVLLMGMLTGIWLCVQSPFAHAQRMQADAAAAGQQAAGIAVVAEEVPCHGDHPPAPDAISDVVTDAVAHGGADTGAGCCEAGHCDGHCVQFSWAFTAPTPQHFTRGMAWLIPLELAGLQHVHQPEPFRPPI